MLEPVVLSFGEEELTIPQNRNAYALEVVGKPTLRECVESLFGGEKEVEDYVREHGEESTLKRAYELVEDRIGRLEFALYVQDKMGKEDREIQIDIEPKGRGID